MYPFLFFDPTMLLLIPSMILAFYAQFKVQSTFNRYLNVSSKRGYTGEEAAREILTRNGLSDVNIELTAGKLSDHYDPRSRVLRLSNDVYYGKSISSISVAAHEVGHAIQHAKNYAPLTIRSNMVPIVNFASNMSWIFIMIGFIVSPSFLNIGILLFSAAVLFQIITLPVEFNASSRAVDQLVECNLIDTQEKKYSQKVLSAAALTYVAAAASAISQLIRLIIIKNQSED